MFSIVQVPVTGFYGKNYVKSRETISFPILEHRNNASWSIANAGHGEYHESIIMYDTYGKGKFEVINLPDMPSRIRDLPAELLTALRYELIGNGKIWMDCGYGASLFTYDNDTFGIYCYTNDGCIPLDFNIHIKGENIKLSRIFDSDEKPMFMQSEINPAYVSSLDKKEDKEYPHSE